MSRDHVGLADFMSSCHTTRSASDNVETVATPRQILNDVMILSLTISTVNDLL